MTQGDADGRAVNTRVVRGGGSRGTYVEMPGTCDFHGAPLELTGHLLALALFEHVVAGLGEDEPTAQSWVEVEPFLLAHALRLTGQSKMGAAAGPPRQYGYGGEWPWWARWEGPRGAVAGSERSDRGTGAAGGNGTGLAQGVGQHFLGKQVGDGDWLIAVGAEPAQPNAGPEGPAVPAVLLTDGPFPAGAALVDGQRAAQTDGRQGFRRAGSLPSPVGRGLARC